MSDETFLAFLYDPNFLRTILPISKECNEVLQAVFHPDARERVNIQELRAMVGRASRWTMGEEELLTTTKAAREAGVTSGLPAALKAKARLQAREKAKDDEKRFVLPFSFAKQSSLAHTHILLSASFFADFESFITVLSTLPTPLLVQL